MTPTPFCFYHKIDRPTPDVKISGAFTSPRRFARQMRYLKGKGIRFLTASEMIEHYLEHGRFPDRSISVMFDDGWKDNFTNAFPILKDLGITATIFLVPEMVGQYTDRVTADGEGPRAHLSESEIREMSAAGIEMASHGLSHKLLDRVTDDEAADEIKRSKSAVEELVQKECKTIAYPAGFFTPAAQGFAREAGYLAAFTTSYGSRDAIDLFAINRTEIVRADRLPFAFARKIAPLLDGR